MDTDTYKLMGATVGHHGPYAFYKALKISRKTGEDQIIAIGDFFFVKIWPDSELMAIGELQLLWTDRGAGRTLVSLRLYFLPENTPAGRAHHGEDEVVGISERVVVRAEELILWVCGGEGWRWGLKAAWAPSPPGGDDTLELEAAAPVAHLEQKLDFADINKEKAAIVNRDGYSVVVFSYPRYCRYRAMLRRLEGLGHQWLRDPIVIALGGFIPPSSNTRILYCRETFEYPELEGHEFVCNHMAPRLKGRARGRRRRARSASRSSASDSETSTHRPVTPEIKRASLRSSTQYLTSPTHSEDESGTPPKHEEKAFMKRLRLFHQRREGGANLKVISARGKDLSLHLVYETVTKAGGYDQVTRSRGWRRLLGSLGAVGHQATVARRNYERLLLPFEHSERRTSQPTPSTPSSNGTASNSNTPISKAERKKHLSNIVNNVIPIATIDISDSPVREVLSSSAEKTPVPRLRTPPPGKRKSHDPKKIDPINLTNGDKKGPDTVKRKILEENKFDMNCKGNVITLDDDKSKPDKSDETMPENSYDPSNILNLNIGKADNTDEEDYVKVSKPAADLNQEFLDSLPGIPPEDLPKENKQEPPKKTIISVVPPEKLMAKDALPSVLGLMNGSGLLPQTGDKGLPARSRPSSLRSVRVKPDRRQGTASGSPPASSNTPVLTPNPASTGPPSDDDLIEVPYKPKTPEIIDLDLYESPESPQTESKRKKLDILKRGGLEVTAVRGWPGLDPAFQQQILNQAHLLQVYGALVPGLAEGYNLPRVTQGKSIYGSPGPEKTVYGNPKDPFMPPPHVLQGAAPRKATNIQKTTPSADVLDLTVKPDIEIMRVSGNSEQPQNLSAKKIIPNQLLEEPRQINSALEITLVNKNHRSSSSSSSSSSRTPQKRSSSGKFLSNKSPSMSSPQHQSSSQPMMSMLQRNHSKNMSAHNTHMGSGLVIPNYQASCMNNSSSVSPPMNPGAALGTSVTSNLLQGAGGTLLQNLTNSSKNNLAAAAGLPFVPLLDTSLYMSALYSNLMGQMAPSLTEQQLALCKELMTGRLSRYTGVTATPTSSK